MKLVHTHQFSFRSISTSPLKESVVLSTREYESCRILWRPTHWSTMNITPRTQVSKHSSAHAQGVLWCQTIFLRPIIHLKKLTQNPNWNEIVSNCDNLKVERYLHNARSSAHSTTRSAALSTKLTRFRHSGSRMG